MAKKGQEKIRKDKGKASRTYLIQTKRMTKAIVMARFGQHPCTHVSHFANLPLSLAACSPSVAVRSSQSFHSLVSEFQHELSLILYDLVRSSYKEMDWILQLNLFLLSFNKMVGRNITIHINLQSCL